MKTLFFCNLISDKDGAFERFLVALAGRFKAAGDRFVSVFADDPIDEVARRLRDRGATWHCIRGWSERGGRVRSWAFPRQALTFLQQEQPDVAAVHFGNELPALTAGLLQRLRGGSRARWVWQQDQAICDPGSLTRHVSQIRMLALAFDHFVAVYEGGRRSLELRGIPAERISVINNAVGDLPAVPSRERTRASLDIPHDALVLIAVSSLLPRKRLDFLLSACSWHLKADVRESETHLLVVGEGPEQPILTRIAEAMGIGKRVHFLGVRDDVGALLRASDIFVHAASAEACSYAILESMAAGLPAVVTRVGAAAEQVADAESGYVVDAEDCNGFADRVRRLAESPDLCAQFGQMAHQRWQDHYRLENTVQQYHDLYRRVAGGESCVPTYSGDPRA